MRGSRTTDLSVSRHRRCDSETTPAELAVVGVDEPPEPWVEAPHTLENRLWEDQRRARHVEGARGHQREQHVLVDGEYILTAAIAVKVCAEPMRKAGIDGAGGLAKPPPKECGPCAPTPP